MTDTTITGHEGGRVSDHMRTQTIITRHDADHLRQEASRVLLSRAFERRGLFSREAGIAGAVMGIAQGLERLAAEMGDMPEWQEPLVAGTFDELLQVLRRTLEQVDPARQAVA